MDLIATYETEKEAIDVRLLLQRGSAADSYRVQRDSYGWNVEGLDNVDEVERARRDFLTACARERMHGGVKLSLDVMEWALYDGA